MMPIYSSRRARRGLLVWQLALILLVLVIVVIVAWRVIAARSAAASRDHPTAVLIPSAGGH